MLRNLLVICAVTWNFWTCNGGMDQFLCNAMYSIQSGVDRGFLTIRDSSVNVYKIIQPEIWRGEANQKWMVEDFQSLGFYDFTPVLFNTTENIVTFEPTKNVYTYKKQWKVKQATTDKFHIVNPESSLCLTNVGSYKEVEEKPCITRISINQLWKFRMLRK